MALKPDRDYAEVTDISQFWSEEEAQNTQEAGGIACVETQGSGVAMDNPENVVRYSADPSGAIPKGVLLQPINPAFTATRDYKNFHNNEVRPGDKVTLLRKGWLVTDMITGSSPVAGDDAYVAASGLISKTQATGAKRIGRFETSPDADGFVKIYVDF